MLCRFFKTIKISLKLLATHAVDIAVIISLHSLLHYVSHLPNHSSTFFSSSSQVVHWPAENTNKCLRPNEGRSDRLSDQASEFALAHLTPISHSAK